MKETMIEKDVTYTLEFGEKFYIIEYGPPGCVKRPENNFFS